MATKTAKKTTKKTSKSLILGSGKRFNLTTVLVIAALLSLVGLFVLRTFAASYPTLLASAGCPAPKSDHVGGYNCYQATADGWSAKLFFVVLDRSPGATTDPYWPNQIHTRGVVASLNSFLGTTEAKNKFTNLSATAKVNWLYSKALNRTADSGGLSYWLGRFNAVNGTAGKTNGDVVASFLSVTEVASYNNTALRNKILDFMAPGWSQGPPQPCEATGTCPPPPPPPCDVTGTCPPTPCEITGTCPPPVVDVPPAEALPSLGDVSLGDISNSTPDQIDQIIEDNTPSTTSDTPSSEAANRSYSGKLKLTPPSQDVSDGATEFRYYLDAKLKKTVKKSPYAFVLDSTRLKNKKYILTIVSYSGGDKLNESSYILSVKNNLNFWQKLYNVITLPFSG